MYETAELPKWEFPGTLPTPAYSSRLRTTSRVLAKSYGQGSTTLNGLVNAHPAEAISDSTSRPVRPDTGLPNGPLVAPVIHSLPINLSHKSTLEEADIIRRNVSDLDEPNRPDHHFSRPLPKRFPSVHFAKRFSKLHRQRRVVAQSNAVIFPQTQSSFGVDSLMNESATALAMPLSNLWTRSRLIANALSARLTRAVNFISPVGASEKKQFSQPGSAAEWFFTTAPFSTYQQMRIIARSGTYVQDVASPSPWSVQTWGYQLNGGIRWHQWDAAVSYGQLRRWAYYERATDAYQVEPEGPSTYQVKRRTEAVAENASLSLLGLGISRQYDLDRHHRQYNSFLTYWLPTKRWAGCKPAGGLRYPWVTGINSSLDQRWPIV